MRRLVEREENRTVPRPISHIVSSPFVCQSRNKCVSAQPLQPGDTKDLITSMFAAQQIMHGSMLKLFPCIFGSYANTCNAWWWHVISLVSQSMLTCDRWFRGVVFEAHNLLQLICLRLIRFSTAQMARVNS